MAAERTEVRRRRRRPGSASPRHLRVGFLIPALVASAAMYGVVSSADAGHHPAPPAHSYVTTP